MSAGLDPPAPGVVGRLAQAGLSDLAVSPFGLPMAVREKEVRVAAARAGRPLVTMCFVVVDPEGWADGGRAEPWLAAVELGPVGGDLLLSLRDRVRTLEDRPMVPAGDHEIVIDGRDETGRPLASGVYFFKVDTSEGSRVGRAIMLK